MSCAKASFAAWTKTAGLGTTVGWAGAEVTVAGAEAVEAVEAVCGGAGADILSGVKGLLEAKNPHDF